MKTFLSTIAFSCILLSLSAHGMLERLCDELYLNESYNKTRKSSSRLKDDLIDLLKRKQETAETMNLLKNKILNIDSKPFELGDAQLSAKQFNNSFTIANNSKGYKKKLKNLESNLISTTGSIEAIEKTITEQERIERNLFDLRNYFKYPPLFIGYFAIAAPLILAATEKDPKAFLPATFLALLIIFPFLAADYMCDKY